MTNVIFESYLHNIHLVSNLIFRPVEVVEKGGRGNNDLVVLRGHTAGVVSLKQLVT